MGLTALLLVEDANLPSVLARLVAQLALVAVADAVVAADRLELGRAGGTLAAGLAVDLAALGAPLADL